MLCEQFAQTSAMAVVALRPPGVWTPETYSWVGDARQADPDFEWSPFWEYGAFVDGRDLATACVAALTADLEGFTNMFIASSDITTSGRSSLELVRELHPDVEWRGADSYRAEPFQTLLRIDRARTVLGWEPEHTWQRFLADGTG